LWNRWEKVRARIFPFSSLIPPAFVCCSVLFDKESLEFLRLLFSSFLAYWTRNFNFEMCGSSFSCSTSPSPHTQQLLLSCMAFVWMNPTIIYGSCFIAIHYSLLYFFSRKSFRLIYIPSSFYLLYAFICWWYWWWWWIITVLLWLFPLLIVNCSSSPLRSAVCQPTYLIVHPHFFYFILFSTCALHIVCISVDKFIYICTYGCRYFYCCWNANAMHDIKTGWMKFFLKICEEKEVNLRLGWDVGLDAFFENAGWFWCWNVGTI